MIHRLKCVSVLNGENALYTIIFYIEGYDLFIVNKTLV